jgi:uncharacterized iron-regulated protein
MAQHGPALPATTAPGQHTLAALDGEVARRRRSAAQPRMRRRAAAPRTARAACGAALSLALLCVTAQAGAQVPDTATARAAAVVRAHAGLSSGYTPHRVYDVAGGVFIDFETLAARAAHVDVVFFGERHGHGPTHRLQHALLEALARRGSASLSLEMFERDAATLLDEYVAGAADLETLLAGARPWPRYATDYHALVEEARTRGWRVSAANVPRPIASRIAQAGLAALDTLPPAERAYLARELHCPDDDYRTRFIAEMARHPVGTSDDETEALRYQRYYESQCVKDETMAESIVMLLGTDAARPVVHVNGAFHSDHRDGVPARVLRRDASVTMLTLTSVPVADLDDIDPAPHTARADYLLFTLAPPAPTPTPTRSPDGAA